MGCGASLGMSLAPTYFTGNYHARSLYPRQMVHSHCYDCGGVFEPVVCKLPGRIRAVEHDSSSLEWFG